MLFKRHAQDIDRGTLLSEQAAGGVCVEARNTIDATATGSGVTPLAKAQKCIESSQIHPGHVLLFWLAAIATLQDLFETNHESLELPESVVSAIASIVNRRFVDMFEGDDDDDFQLCFIFS